LILATAKRLQTETDSAGDNKQTLSRIRRQIEEK
jgi:hypothetical protein